MFLRVESNREVGHLLISIWNRQRSLRVGRVIGDEELCKSNRTAALNLLIHNPRVPRTKGPVLHLNPENELVRPQLKALPYELPPVFGAISQERLEVALLSGVEGVSKAPTPPPRLARFRIFTSDVPHRTDWYRAWPSLCRFRASRGPNTASSPTASGSLRGT
jgi:hypothetical protein